VFITGWSQCKVLEISISLSVEPFFARSGSYDVHFGKDRPTMPNLNDFLSRIQTDHTFYLRFRQNPEEALGTYELTSEERAALTESGEQLRARLGQPDSYWKLSCNYALLGSGEHEFNIAAMLGRSEVKNTIDRIREARTYADRLAPVLALVDQIG
jgi:hypothetical protein